MIWILGTSLVSNVVLLVAWLKTLVDARDWKEIARESFERDADDVIRRRSTSIPIEFAPGWTQCDRCRSIHRVGRCIADRHVN